MKITTITSLTQNYKQQSNSKEKTQENNEEKTVVNLTGKK